MRTNETQESAVEAGPRRRYDLVVLAASAGGVQALGTILAALPRDFPPLAVVQHRGVKAPAMLATVLARHTKLTVKLAEEGEILRPSTVYIAPPDRHLVVSRDRTLALVDGTRIRHVLSSANPLFTSASHTFGGRVLAVVLTGGDSDATDGVQSVKARGGTVIAQDRATSAVFQMPHSAIRTGAVDYVLPLDEIGPALVRLVGAGPAQQAQ